MVQVGGVVQKKMDWGSEGGTGRVISSSPCRTPWRTYICIFRPYKQHFWDSKSSFLRTCKLYFSDIVICNCLILIKTIRSAEGKSLYCGAPRVYSFVRVLNLIGFRCRLKIYLIALSPSRAKPGDQRSEHGILYGQVDAEKCNVGGGWQMELIHLSRRRGRPLPHVALWFKVSIYHRYDPTPPPPY